MRTTRWLLVLFVLAASVSYAQVMIDFEDGSLDDWEVVDEPAKNLGDQGPSSWAIRDSQLGLDGQALYQGSNMWGSPGDTMLMGTSIIYKGEMFQEFELDIDVIAADNDGMGVVWAFESTARHYRVMMINDGWPSPPLDGNSGPMIIAHQRFSDDDPWYDLIDVENGFTYAESAPIHWNLTVSGGTFTFTHEDDLGNIEISGDCSDYEAGYLGIQLYAQQAEFDNFSILDTHAVDPAGKLASVWGKVKQ